MTNCTNPSFWNNTNNQDCYLCFSMIRQETSFNLGWVYLIMVLIFMGFTIRTIRNYRKNMQTLVSGVYFILMLWAIFTLIETLYSQILYMKIIDQQFWQQNMRFVLISNYLIFLITFSKVFLLNTSILMGSYHWHSNLVKYIRYNNQLSSSENKLLPNQQSRQLNRRLKKSLDNKINKIISIYLPIRQVILIIWAISLILVSTCKHSYEMVKYKFVILTYFMVMIDSLLLFVMFCLRYYSISKNQILRQKMDRQELKKLKNKFIFLIFCTFLQTIMFILRNPSITNNEDLNFQFFMNECIFNNKTGMSTYTWLLYIFQSLVLNFIPASIILKLYTYNQQYQNI